jgi:hypothetical protein
MTFVFTALTLCSVKELWLATPVAIATVAYNSELVVAAGEKY